MEIYRPLNPQYMWYKFLLCFLYYLAGTMSIITLKQYSFDKIVFISYSSIVRSILKASRRPGSKEARYAKLLL